jgi:abequosyltransferase
MDSSNPLLSICIPSYNRPEQLVQLLESVDAQPYKLEIVIGEDAAPRRAEVQQLVAAFRRESPYLINYYENERNLGYDGNLRSLIERARAEFVLFMGDDDRFAPGRLEPFLDFLYANRDVGYVLRSYYSEHPDGTLEEFKYFPSACCLSPGVETSVFLFKRSVSICGVTFKRSCALNYATDRFDGTLLYQLYLVAEIALHNPVVYCDIPVAIQAQSFRLDNPQFGAALAEKDRFQPGKVTAHNSINFTKGFFAISRYIDQKYGLDITTGIRYDLSKYSYPFLSIQRKRGRIEFWRYALQLARETGINQTWHYYFYMAALWFLGETLCDKGIVWAKRLVGYTPRL